MTQVLSNSSKAAIRIAAKCGFISRKIWEEQVTDCHRSWSFRQWQALQTENLFKPCSVYGADDRALILTPKGKAHAWSMGLHPVNPPGGESLWHDDELAGLALRLEKQGLITQWLTESELKRNRMREFIPYHDDNIKAKYPDLILQLKHPKDHVLWAVEYERSRKEKTRYYDLIQSYSGPSRINAILVIAATQSIVDGIQRAIDRLSYPQAKRPVIFTDSRQFLRDPINAEIRFGEKRSSIATAVSRWNQKSSAETQKAESNARNIERNNVACDIASISQPTIKTRIENN